MTLILHRYPLSLPRSAFTPREVAPAVEIWRLMQEMAVLASADGGWPPARYVAEGRGFIVSEATVAHHAEARWGAPIQGETWISDLRRGILVWREVRLGMDGATLATASQRWAHVTSALTPVRVPPDLAEAFTPGTHPEHGSTALPGAPDEVAAPEHSYAFACWQGWMDPQGHVNHPVYVDWCDEGVRRLLAAAGVNPHRLRPVAERVRWRNGVEAGDAVRVSTRLVGWQAPGVARITHEVTGDDGRLFASAVTLRALAGPEDDGLARALVGGDHG